VIFGEVDQPGGPVGRRIVVIVEPENSHRPSDASRWTRSRSPRYAATHPAFDEAGHTASSTLANLFGTRQERTGGT
jgi:hypothetical protein